MTRLPRHGEHAPTNDNMTRECRNDQRRALVRAHLDKDGKPDMNGLDYVEVSDDGKTLLAYFIGKLPVSLQTNGPSLNKTVRIEGGRRVRDIKVLDVDPHVEGSAETDDYLVISLDKAGDFSTYSLCLVGVEGIDPFYDHAEFSFKVDCPSDLDCASQNPCPPEVLDEPDINYLAKDYASFRQLLLDRLALIMPDWKERHAPDLGITLVELLSYAGDHLSYYQDAVATESYLDTARQRISVRRHARLVDYYLHEGCNARAWLALSLLGTDVLEIDPQEIFFLAMLDSSLPDQRELLSADQFRQIPPDAYEVFEPVTRSKFTLRQAGNEIQFYTWGQRECCLLRATTSATLLDHYVLPATLPMSTNTTGSVPQARAGKSKSVARQKAQEPANPELERALNLQAGDVLIFEEVIGPKTGKFADADPSHRIAVRLTKVTLNHDQLVMISDPRNQSINTNPSSLVVPTGDYSADLPTPVVEIEWQTEDALPFALCLSAVTSAPGCEYIQNITLARANVLLVDHGRTIRPPQEIGTVPLDVGQLAGSKSANCDCEGHPADEIFIAGRYNPRISFPGMTYRQDLPANGSSRRPGHKHSHKNSPERSLSTRFASLSAKGLQKQDPRSALPQIWLDEVPSAPDGQGGLIPLFKMSDVADSSDLVKRLRVSHNPFDEMLFGKLSLKTQRNLAQLSDGQDAPQNLLDDVSADLKALLRTWLPRFDLLSSGPDDLHFVVEVDNNGVANLRFGNGDLGEQPQAGSSFYATYRLGNGSRGNLGAEALKHTVYNLNGASLAARNPLPATSGLDAEPISEAKLYAPFTFRKQIERAVIADDYANIAMREFKPEIQRATASLAWNGSWDEVDVALDPFRTEAESFGLEQDVCDCLNHYRRIGHDLRVEKARYVPLDIELNVCVSPGFLRGHVKAALLDVFSSGLMRKGDPGFFHPDRLTFGEDIYLSRIIARAQAVEGVNSVEVTRLQRLFEAPNHEIENGVLPFGPFEIGQIDSDPDFPERGRFALVMAGGR